ncbi:hypothetical protein BO99DRAFT_182848 [Aspergillus violaceofuscus CBS 115571]|uniref:Uncharacterized protein n=1 Tax=Aspergillus violaceofuscus (strain CBS 115571) TaxID=1450538 RepID=A0A2V5HPX4_ASPV1|nr:hypothetical protein BO99DRAFT_182848 [Aspergillus violaceofuscus CBS 115571]
MRQLLSQARPNHPTEACRSFCLVEVVEVDIVVIEVVAMVAVIVEVVVGVDVVRSVSSSSLSTQARPYHPAEACQFRCLAVIVVVVMVSCCRRVLSLSLKLSPSLGCYRRGRCQGPRPVPTTQPRPADSVAFSRSSSVSMSQCRSHEVGITMSILYGVGVVKLMS